MQYKYTLPQEKSFTLNDVMGFAYSDARNYEGVDAVRIIIDGQSGEARTGAYDRVYLVLVGKGEFTIEGESFFVGKDDVIIVPKHVTYEYHGSMELFEVNAPAFRIEQ